MLHKPKEKYKSLDSTKTKKELLLIKKYRPILNIQSDSICAKVLTWLCVFLCVRSLDDLLVYNNRLLFPV